MTETDCIALEALPGTSRLFRDVVTGSAEALRFYAGASSGNGTARDARARDSHAIANILERQNRAWGASEQTFANIARLREGAAAVVTGQQVALFGGPLYSFLKAATAIARSKAATEAGHPTVPVFWMATEDHDFAEVSSAWLMRGEEAVRLSVAETPELPAEVGGFVPGESLTAVVREAEELLGLAAQPEFALDAVRAAYAPGRTMAEMFARLMLRVFHAEGLVVMDASGREVHALGAEVLRKAITDVAALHDALERRTGELVEAGYHAQVLVAEDSSLLFLVREDGARVALKYSRDTGEWRAGSATYSAQELLRILEDAPERLSPSALLRPVFQDSVLPTAMYIAGPAELAYFAQTNVLAREILGFATPVAPRLSATVVTPKVARVLRHGGLSMEDTWTRAEELAVRLGARAMPVERKQELSALGNAVDGLLRELQADAAAADTALGHSAEIAGNKIRYQMNRLRRLMARFEEQREPAIARRAKLAVNALYPGAHLQERVIAGLWFLAEAGEPLVQMLVDAAKDPCPGHRVVYL